MQIVFSQPFDTAPHVVATLISAAPERFYPPCVSDVTKSGFVLYVHRTTTREVTRELDRVRIGIPYPISRSDTLGLRIPCLLASQQSMAVTVAEHHGNAAFIACIDGEIGTAYGDVGVSVRTVSDTQFNVCVANNSSGCGCSARQVDCDLAVAFHIPQTRRIKYGFQWR